MRTVLAVLIWSVALGAQAGVPPVQPAALQVKFDATLAEMGIAYLASGDEALVTAMARTPGAAHLLLHARAWDYKVPITSPGDLVRALLVPREAQLDRIPAARQALAFFKGPMHEDPTWVEDAARGLPKDLRLSVELFLTFGYDIGVANPGTASLNAAHPHFAAHPGELRYYAIHELHHAAFMTLHPPRPKAQWRMASDLLEQAEYALQLEGMAVWAAWERRRQDGALSWDEDYRALEDEALLRRLEAKYLEVHRALEASARAGEPADAARRALLLDLYGKERIFYRFGAWAARQIELRRGQGALVALVKAGPRAFLQAYLSVRGEGLVP
jgi:hypothetical protein